MRTDTAFAGYASARGDPGVAGATMSRDEGWHFLVLGRSIERADMTARLLTTTALAGVPSGGWKAALRACGAHESFLRTYRGIQADEAAAEFLLLDRLFPRSIISALRTAERCLEDLAAGGRGRLRRRGAAAAGPGAGRAGVPAPRGHPGRPARRDGAAPGDLQRRRRGHRQQVLRPPRRSTGQEVCDADAARGHPHHRLHLRQAGHLLLQRGPDDAGHQPGAAGAGQQAGRLARAVDMRYRDYWGSIVTAFEVHEPHERCWSRRRRRCR